MTPTEEKIKNSIKLVESMVESNATDKEIAEKIGVSYSTFKRYKAENSELKAIIAQGKDKKIQTVEQALFKCCTGYSYYEEIVTKVKEEYLADDGQTMLTREDVKISSVKKYRGPDLAAQKYYLNNRKKADWKEDPHKVTNDKENIKIKKEELKAKRIEI